MKEEKMRRVALPDALFWTLLLIAVAYGLLQAASAAFVNDDAFISFRYAKNFVNHLGLVYNEGERVEGYTNFLWTLIIAAGIKSGFDPVPFSQFLGILFFALTLSLFAFLSWSHRPAGKKGLLILPLTTLALCLHRDFTVYATSGLETSLFAFLVSCGLALLLLNPSGRRLMLPGLALTLAVLTRPDGMLFLGASVVFITVARGFSLRNFFFLLLPLAVIYLPYWIWRYGYYGYPFPNTYYAKSADLSYYEQGFRYAALYLKTYYVLLLAPLLGGWLLIVRRTNRSSDKAPARVTIGKDPFASALLLLLLSIAAYGWFVIRVGGDFMFARFFIPLTPLAYFLIERLINRVSLHWPNIVLCSLVLAGTYYRNDQYRDALRVDDVTDEWQFYTNASLEQARRDGAALKRYFNGLPVRIAFFGTQARLMYYADPPVAIEAAAGLTDALIAHLPLVQRGVPGHEKLAPSWYLHQRGVHFMLLADTSKMLDNIDFGGIRGRIHIYDARIMSKLAAYPEVKFVSCPDYLDTYIRHLPTLPVEQVRRDYERFKIYYFDANADSARLNPFLRAIARR